MVITFSTQIKNGDEPTGEGKGGKYLQKENVLVWVSALFSFVIGWGHTLWLLFSKYSLFVALKNQLKFQSGYMSMQFKATNYMEHLSFLRFFVARFGRGERRIG